MIFGFDIRPLQMHHRFRGIGMHMMHLLSNILQILPAGSRVVFYQYEGMEDGIQFIKLPKNLKYEVIYLPQITAIKVRIPFFIKEAFQNTRRVTQSLPSEEIRKSDVFMSFDFMHGLPAENDTKLVTVAYDLIPLVFPKEYFPNFFRSLGMNGFNVAARDFVVKHLYRWAAVTTAKRSTKLITISNSTADQFEKIVPGSAKKSVTVYLGAPDEIKLSKKEIVELMNSMPLLSEDYLLYIGGGDVRRKIEHLVFAFDKLKVKYPELKLILAGKDFTSEDSIPTKGIVKSIRHSNYRNDIYLLGFISEQQRELLYRNARCFVYPTLSEGFGLPILEAMQASCPVVSYKYSYSSVQEVAGNAALLTDPSKINLYDQLILLMDDSSLSASLRKRGHANVAKFTWQKNATETLNIIMNLN